MLQQLREKILEANESYRIGSPIISDKEYDTLVDNLIKLSPDDSILSIIGHSISSERKSKLPIEMASMNKIKNIDDIENWIRLKGISKSEVLIITPKLDGLSFCVEEKNKKAWTRGDGEYGQKSDDHYKLIKNHLKENPNIIFTYGEVMMSKETFTKKYSLEFSNPRNLVAGLLNSKDISDFLEDCVYIKYGAVFNSEVSTKKQILDILNENQDIKIPYYITRVDKIKENILLDLFDKWSTEYEIDGLILEVNDMSIQNRLGRETSTNNPVWARAFKSEKFEKSKETTVTGISWNISKQGYLKPTVHVETVNIDGVNISNITGNNARFVKSMGIGKGSKVIVKRSGMVIPIIYDVIEPVEFTMPSLKNIEWSENGVELLTTIETDEQRFKQAVSFFEILDVSNVGEGIVKKFWNEGYDSIESILNLTISDMEKIEGFGKRKSSIVYNSIQKSIKNLQLSKLQHASGIFKGLGSKKLIKLEKFKTKPTIDQVMEIDGFAETSAKSYIDGYDKFFDFIKKLPISINNKEEVELQGDKFLGKTFVFTGVRMPEYEKVIEKNGGKIGSSISKSTTYLVCKSTGSGSSKEKKAIELGINILEVSDLEKMINL